MDYPENNDFNILNGRVNLLDPNLDTAKIYNNPELCNEKNVNIINRNYSGNCVSELFFSEENIKIVQTGIINSVFNISEGQYLISNQSEQELKIIMRSMYFQYGKNLDYNIIEQIKELNTLVIRWSVNEIIKNIKQYIEYKKSISTLPMPMERAVLPSQKGTKTLEIKSFI
jgi:hypothetical protein